MGRYTNQQHQVALGRMYEVSRRYYITKSLIGKDLYDESVILSIYTLEYSDLHFRIKMTKQNNAKKLNNSSSWRGTHLKLSKRDQFIIYGNFSYKLQISNFF